MRKVPAGWYALPDGTQRYWNGSQWVAPSAPPTGPSPASTPPRKGLADRLQGWSTPLIVLVAAVVGIPASLASAAVVGATAATMLTSSEPATVTKIVDGDTFDVTVNGESKRVRLLNVDTPESVEPGLEVQCLAIEATQALTTLIPVGSTVTLGYDVSRRDQYGRTLAGVTTAQGLLVNAELARLGLGLPVVVGDNRKFAEPVAAASRSAQEAKVGLFAPTTACSVAADVAAVETASSELQAAPAPTTVVEADALVAQAAAVAALAASLDARLQLRDAFEVVTLPASVRMQYADISTAATSRANEVSAAAQASAAGFVRAAQEKAAADAAKAKAAADAKAKAAAEAKAKAAAAAAQKRTIVAAPKPNTGATPKSTSKPRSTTKPPASSTTGCVIKGNISSSGEKIYHVPGGGSYSATKIDLSKGERWFCSESAAVAAGWRKARN